MSSRIGWMVTLAIAEPISRNIQRGKPSAVVTGGLIGGIAGGCGGWAIAGAAAPPLAMLGALVAAALGGALVRRPPKVPPPQPDLGRPLRYWSVPLPTSETNLLVVLLEGGVFRFMIRKLSGTKSSPSFAAEKRPSMRRAICEE